MAQPTYRGDVLIDNRYSLIVDCRFTQAVGWIAEMRRNVVTSHADQNTSRLGGSAIDSRTSSHEGYIHRTMLDAASRRCLAGSNGGADCAGSNCAAPKG